jgi:hypothetical protein
MKSPQLILLEAELAAVRPFAQESANHELASLAAKREIELLKDLQKERSRLAKLEREGVAA